MARPFGNCAFTFKNGRGKPIFVPSASGRQVSEELRTKLANFRPDPFFFHLLPGGHVGAIHALRSKRYFARLDFENFFYSIGRNRVARVLQTIGVERAEYYARWSTVKNPYGAPSYALPYGFPQSPILATLVLAHSHVGEFLREIDDRVMVSVYVDDIALASNNLRRLNQSYRQLCQKVEESNFRVNGEKSVAPAVRMELFNCHLEHMQTAVTAERRSQFYSEGRSARSEAAFETYCNAIATGNA